MVTRIVIITIALLLVFLAIRDERMNAKRLRMLKECYEASLKKDDRQAALEAGRAYYSALGEGRKLTLQDEQAIADDLRTMNQTATSHPLNSDDEL